MAAAPGLTGGLIAVGAVVVVALILRAAAGSRQEEGSVPAVPEPLPPPEPARPARLARAEPDGDADGDEDDGDDGLVVAVSSDGRAFVPDLHVVRVVPPSEEGEEWKVGSRLERVMTMNAPGSSWSPGDLRGARVVRGDFDAGPWILEALGRDGEYLTFAFETSDAAEAAKALFDRLGVVQLGEDEDGRPMPPSAEQFEEARRIYEETAAQLDLPDDLPGDEPGERQEGTP